MHTKYYVFALALACFGLQSCNNSGDAKSTANTTQAPTEIEIPNLLERSGDIGSPEEAQKMSNTFLSIKNTIRQNPKDYGARLKMADLYIVEARATGNYNYYFPAALNMIDGVLAEKPENTDDQFRAYSSKAVILLSLHRFEEAREMGEKALTLNPNNSRVYGILTDANVELGDYDKAVVMSDSMVQKRPDLRSYSRVSYLREIYGDVEGAKEAMNMAVNAGYPGHEETSWSRVTLGNLYQNYGDLTNAEMQYRMALENRPNYPFALAGLGMVEAKKGNFDGAEIALKKAIEVREEAAFYENLAIVYRAQGLTEKMATARTRAFELLKGLAGEHSHGDHNHAHKDGEAHSHSHAKENAHGHSHEVGLEMAKMQMDLNEDYKEALHNADHEFERRPKNIEVNKAMAHIYLETKELTKAEEHLKKAMATNSKDPELMLIGGMIMLEKGQTAEGKKMIKKGLEINPYMMSNLAKEAKMKVS